MVHLIIVQENKNLDTDKLKVNLLSVPSGYQTSTLPSAPLASDPVGVRTLFGGPSPDPDPAMQSSSSSQLMMLL